MNQQAQGTFVTAYIEAAYWTEEEQVGDAPLSDDALASINADCERFIEQAGDLLDNMSPEQAGHDFWLTRNRHGAGFWDRDLGAVGERLTEIAHGFGESDLYVGDDSLAYV